nr:hypothetical protein Itr_chr10CG06480 [Ipomoea trifida]
MEFDVLDECAFCKVGECSKMEISQLNDQVAQLQHLVWDKGSMLVSQEDHCLYCLPPLAF